VLVGEIMRHFHSFIFISFLCQGAEGSNTDELIANQQQFADGLTTSLYTNPNECTSSLGVSMCFGLIYPCMSGDAKTQTENVFGYPENNTQLVWDSITAQIVAQYTSNPLVVIENSIWIDDQGPLHPDYKAIILDYLFTFNFQDTGAGEQVNAWVKEKTRGLIDSIVNNGPIYSMILAVNTIYLNGNWQTVFSPSRTNQDVFYDNASWSSVVLDDAHFMHIVDYFPYSRDALPEYQLVQMPFIVNTLSMIWVLPTSDSSDSISTSELIAALPSLERTRLAVGLPKFHIELTYEESLTKSLKDIGIVEPFSGGLCVYENDCSSTIDIVIQKTVIDIDEDGVEAAAVTAIGVTGASPGGEGEIIEPDPISQMS
jgi:serpin B